MMNRLKPSLLPLIISLLAASLALNVYLYQKARHFFALFQVTRFDPLNQDTFPPPDPENRPDEIRVVFFGDSRAVDWPAPEVSGRFTFINRGIAGHTSTQSNLRFAQHVQPLQPDILIVQVCVNDLLTLGVLPQQYDPVVVRCRQNLDNIIAAAHEQGSLVILTTVFPLGRMTLADRSFYSDRIPAGIEEVNAYIRSLEGDKVVVFDTVPLLTDGDDRVRDEFAADWLHLNPAGYTALNQELARLLNTLDT